MSSKPELPKINLPTFYLIEGIVIDGTCRVDRIVDRAKGFKPIWERSKCGDDNGRED